MKEQVANLLQQKVFLVPTLQRGNAYRDAPASHLECVWQRSSVTSFRSTLERRDMHSHAGAWERGKSVHSPEPLYLIF